MIIDSSHNLWIDVLTKYGLVGLIALIAWIGSRWKQLGETAKVGLILGLTFFSMNVVVVSHSILLVYFLTAKNHRDS